ncbi:MAG: hypothetical protein GC154_04795 [bacterium]|nr:hypothetical protein [bacterium]
MMDERKEWIRCSAVSISFYLIVYILLGSTVLEFTNPWLIGTVLVLAAGDVIALPWLIRHYSAEDDNDDDYF